MVTPLSTIVTVVLAALHASASSQSKRLCRIRRPISLVCIVAFVTLMVPVSLRAGWIKSPPDTVPDVDKTEPDATCWLATAANMLAGADYGNGTTTQQKAEDIYNELIAKYGPDD